MAGKREKDSSGQEKRKKRNETEVDAGYATGYDTDGASTSAKNRTRLKKKTKPRKPSGDGYETDDGYMSSSTNQPGLRKQKSKSRFFKLGNRSKPSLEEEEVPTPVEPPPPLPTPAFRLPIAERFATTLNLSSDTASLQPTLGPLGAPTTTSPTMYASVSPSTPSPAAVNVPPPIDLDREDVESSIDAHEPSIMSGVTAASSTTSPSKRTVIRFASGDSSDNHGTTSSSNGSHSFLSRFTTGSSSSASTNSLSSPKPKPLAISYPLTRSPSPPSPPYTGMPTQIPPAATPPPVIAAPKPNKNSKPAPRPLFLHRIPSDQGKVLGSYSRSNSNSNSRNNSPSEWSPAGSPFVVLTPNPTGAASSPTAVVSSRPGLSATSTNSSSRSTNSSNTVTKLDVPSPRLGARAPSPAGSHRSRDVVPSADFIVPSPSTEIFVPPHNLEHYDLPPPSPPPTGPLPRIPGGGSESQPQQQHLEPEASLSVSTFTSRPSTPQRGRVSPFPARPVLPNAQSAPNPSTRGYGLGGFESRVQVKRYRDLYAMPAPVEPAGGWQSGARRHARQSTKVGISVEHPSDDEDEYGYGYDDEEEELKNVVLRGFTDGRSASEMGHHDRPGHGRGGHDAEPEAALDRRRSLEALQSYYYNSALTPRERGSSRERKPRVSFSPSVSDAEDDLSDDKSRYTSDEKHSMYRHNNASQPRSLASGWADDSRWSMSGDGDWQSRASFMDAEKSDQARERFVRRIEGMFDENGRELPPNWGVGRNAVVPPVPKIPKGKYVEGSRTWI